MAQFLWSSRRYHNQGVILVNSILIFRITKQVEVAKKMLEGTLMGSAFRGRVLMAMDTHQQPDAKLGKYKVNAAKDPPQQPYLLRFDLYEGAEFQVDSKF
jgi:hypothetical protein